MKDAARGFLTFENWTFVLQNPDGNTFVTTKALEKFVPTRPGLHGIDASVASTHALIAGEYPTVSVLSYIAELLRGSAPSITMSYRRRRGSLILLRNDN